jgi:hypothetical protein
MTSYWLAGTRPEKTKVSVPRLTPEWSVRTSTSSCRGRGTETTRISPDPGARSQKARAVPTLLPMRISSRLNRGTSSCVLLL